MPGSPDLTVPQDPNSNPVPVVIPVATGCPKLKKSRSPNSDPQMQIFPKSKYTTDPIIP